MGFSVYTDGSSRGNPGPGGWAGIIFTAEKVEEIGGREEKTTNNRMEMRAVLEALYRLPVDAQVEVHTDSSYLLSGITKWVKAWEKNGWMTKTGEEVLNRDLWDKLSAENNKRKVKWQKVVGHSGHAYNERCDAIATLLADNKKVNLYSGSLASYPIKAREGSRVNTSSSKGRAGKAYSYVSRVGSLIQTHRTWAECEARVKGAPGARFKKALSAEEEREIINQFH